MKKIIFFLFIAPLHSVNAQTITPPDDYILDQMRPEKIPGVVTALVKDGKLAYTKGYGVADIDKDIPYTPNSIQGIQSISKIVTATAIMKLWEQHEFELDDPINDYLPFPITNPYYPNTAITFRMLLCHTSSVDFGNRFINATLPQISGFYPGTAPALEYFLQNYFVPGGSFYVDSVSYYRFEPGTQFVYSNYGYAILGYLVERISGQLFHEYCNENIFSPLCMNNTAWYYSELDINLAVTPYDAVNSFNHPFTYDLYEWVDYPAMGLKSTVFDISRFMQMHLNYGILEGVRIIESETEDMMRSVQVTIFDDADIKLQYCLGLFKITEHNNNNTIVFGHNGNGPGVVTQANFVPDNNTVIVVFSNCSNSINHEFTIRDIHLKIHIETSATISTADKPILNCSYVLNPCPQNESYWNTHQAEWPLNSVPMKIGTKHFYAKNQILELLGTEPNGDASIVLGKALAIAKFNLGQGSELSEIIPTVNEAMIMIGDKRLPYNVPVPVSSPTGIQMLSLAATLNSYNSGALNENDCSGSVTRSSGSSEIEKNADLNELKIWPNPSRSITQISFAALKNERISIELYDISGRLVKIVADRYFSEGRHQIALDTDDLKAGIYILRIQSEGLRQTKKIVILK